jgi:hypothetical protein
MSMGISPARIETAAVNAMAMVEHARRELRFIAGIPQDALAPSN